MLTSLVLAVLAQSPIAPPVAAAPERPDRIRSLVDTADPDDDPKSLGGLSTQPFGQAPFSLTVINPVSVGWTLGGRPFTLDIVLTGLGSGYVEKFLLQLPMKTGGAKRPLLMVFHKYGSNPNDPYLHTTFPFECSKRNWFLFSALGATKKSFSSLESQQNRDDALSWVMSLYGDFIDQDRIYGVGFSMGGGSAVNWAARHQDPAGLRVAALVDHTGGVALEHTWANEVPEIHDVLKFWFGGPPGPNAFQFQRSSALSFKPGTLVPNQVKSLGTNLAHVPMQIVHADDDPLAYLVEQTKAFKDFMVSLGALVDYQEVDNDQHEWSTLNEKEACNFLSAFQVSTPLSGDTLADRDGDWFWFGIQQDFSGDFTPFTWEIDTANNKFWLSNTANLKRLRLDLSQVPLDLSGPLNLELEATDLFGDIIDLDGYTAAPTAVLRDGQTSSAWAWDAAKGRVTLFEADFQKHTWRVMP